MRGAGGQDGYMRGLLEIKSLSSQSYLERLLKMFELVFQHLEHLKDLSQQGNAHLNTKGEVSLTGL